MIFLFVLVIIFSISACSLSNIKKKPSQKATEKPIVNLYQELDQLPQKYNSELAQKNGDVVNAHGLNYNIEKLDQFIETYKNNKTEGIDRIRITNYTTEGDAIISDLIIGSEGLKMIEDSTRDNFSNTENRTKKEFKIVDIVKTNKPEGITYSAKTEQGEERFLFYRSNQ